MGNKFQTFTFFHAFLFQRAHFLLKSLPFYMCSPSIFQLPFLRIKVIKICSMIVLKMSYLYCHLWPKSHHKSYKLVGNRPTSHGRICKPISHPHRPMKAKRPVYLDAEILKSLSPLFCWRLLSISVVILVLSASACF